jgi:hypothetical protein
MNILYILQQSVYNSDRKWVTADSNVDMMRGIINKLVQETDWHFYIMIGKLADFHDIKEYSQIIDSPQVHWIEMPFPVDAFLNRQNFDIFLFEKIMKDLPSIDVIWNNITEVSRNIKTWMHYRKYPAKLVSACYWLDCPEINEPKVPEDISYMWRQFDGFECSDLVAFTCSSTRSGWLQNARKVFHPKFTEAIGEKSVLWDFGYSADELDGYRIANRNQIVPDGPPIIVFLNRMSEINYTHHMEFIKAIQEIDKRFGLNLPFPFRVYFTNPSGKVGWEWLKVEVPYLEILPGQQEGHVLTREQYAELLWKSSISVHLFDIERYGGCAHRESVHCNNLPITKPIFEYARIAGQKYPFYIKDFKPDTIANALIKALDGLWFVDTPDFKNMKRQNYLSSYEYMQGIVIRDLEDLVYGKEDV